MAMPTLTQRDRHRGCLLGLACGDAVGTTVEFKTRGTFPPVTDMVGGGPFRLPPGAWTDDTSMALCLGTSLVECRGFDAFDQMKRYVRWRDEGYLSSTGACFDCGVTISDALSRFKRTGDPRAGSTDRHTAGNGCLMRLAPVPMFFHRDPAEAVHWSSESARTTHGCTECVEATRLLAAMLVAALRGASKQDVLFSHDPAAYAEPKVQHIAAGHYRDATASKVRGSGYVIDCLEASAWCVLNSSTFEDAILLAANLGDDADTTAAVTGQLAGAMYGDAGIPEHWLERLVMRSEITQLADDLLNFAAP